MTEFVIGPAAVTAYRRLSYTAWHAFAEFVDNSTQAYFDNRALVDAHSESAGISVDISYDGAGIGKIVISDDSAGMTGEELDRAMLVGVPPADPSGRSRYGLGLKTAACWLGDNWTVETSKAGEAGGTRLEVNVKEVAAGHTHLPTTEFDAEPGDHFTIITITHLNRRFHGRTVGKIKDFLASMYRRDLRSRDLKLSWQGEAIKWTDVGLDLLTDVNGDEYRREIDFEVDGRQVTGWAGVLERGSRANAGFLMLHNGRAVQAGTQAWRPTEVFGEGAPNDLVNQRLVGEVELDAFDVTHTKDNVLWDSSLEEAVERGLRQAVEDLIDVAKSARTSKRTGPSEASARRVATALASRARAPLAAAPEESAITEREEQITRERATLDQTHGTTRPDFRQEIAGREVVAYLVASGSSEAPYIVAPESWSTEPLTIYVSLQHPILQEVSGTAALALYTKCVLTDLVHLARREPDVEVDSWIAERDQILRSWDD